MSDVLVRDLSLETLEALKGRAKRNKRSLQAELKWILEQAAQTTMVDGREVAADFISRDSSR